MKKKVDVFLLAYEDALLGKSYGCDVRILTEDATVADFLQAVDDFAAAHLAECKGCDGCCRERAPLIAADIPALAALLPSTDFPAHAVCDAFAELKVAEDGAADITLRRTEEGACCFLHAKEKYCTQWPSRAFVCRSHFCLPRSPRFQQLREDIVNMGENELTRLILAEEANAAPPLDGIPLKNRLDPADYPENGQSNKRSYGQILLRQCVTAKFWKQLQHP